jgi:D-alanyl-lipoteichoic acid acyltransferase DltB (MBOAT superfamily)
MLFNSPLYAAFLLGTWVAFWLLAPWRLARALLLVFASYAFYFYGTWDAARDERAPIAAAHWALLCLGILFVGSTLDFFVGLAIGRARRRSMRNLLLFVSVVYYLGLLAVFKYWSFAADSLSFVLASAGVHLAPPHLRLLLPFGISFFTFETMSYTIDVWRGSIEPTPRYLDYLLFVGFFPHLVAGPIVRPARMLPQLAAPPRADSAVQARGLLRIAAGLAKKIVIGDYLAQALVARVFATPERFTSLEVLLSIYGYAAQIYADFSGYCDVAIGSAALFGYELPENFDAPYGARSLQEFWRRWHITLGAWLRDYLYKPLGGSRAGLVITCRNLMITMVLGGLWHGASWNFVAWGAFHGAGLVVTRIWQQLRPDRGEPPIALRWLQVAATFHFVCLGWVLFRAPSLTHAALILQRVARGGWTTSHIAPRVALVAVAALGLHWVPRRWGTRWRDAFVETPAFVQGIVLAAAAVALHLAAAERPEPFVYGQF